MKSSSLQSDNTQRETARAELRRRNLLSFLRSDRPAWQEKDHPELASGTSNFVRRLRKESDRPLS